MKSTEMISPQQVAELIGVEVQTVFNWIRRNKVPEPYRIAGTVRWNKAELMDWFETMKSRTTTRSKTLGE